MDGEKILIVGIAEPHAPILEAGLSLAGFLFAALCCGRCAGWLGGPRSRTWVFLSLSIQALAVVLVAALFGAKTLRLDDRPSRAVLAVLLGLSGGMQVAMARGFGHQEIPTAMLTSPFVDLLIDPYLFRLRWNGDEVVSRNRRICYISAICLGAVVGAGITKGASTDVCLIVVAAYRTAMIPAFFLVARLKKSASHDGRKPPPPPDSPV